MSLRPLVLLVGLPLAAQAALVPQNVDFSNYDLPLYAQVIDRARAKISARLGEGTNTRDRYFIVPFAYQNRGNDPEFSHSFISFIRVLADNKQVRRTPGLAKRRYKNQEFETFTISWLPRDFLRHPHLCVFNGAGSRLLPEKNACPLLPGRNFSLEETIKLAADAKVAVAMGGPCEMNKTGFDLGIKRKRLLDGGSIKYRADDRLFRKNRVAINCFHAMAGLDEIFPNGGLFGTGFNTWGFNGIARVLIEYDAKARAKGLVLERMDIKRDRYGFV